MTTLVNQQSTDRSLFLATFFLQFSIFNLRNFDIKVVTMFDKLIGKLMIYTDWFDKSDLNKYLLMELVILKTVGLMLCDDIEKMLQKGVFFNKLLR